MNADERIEVLKEREYLVVKSNELVQRNRFALSLAEQKAVAYICSMIKPADAVGRAKGADYQLEYEFNIRDFCKVCGITYDSGRNYAEIKATLKSLRDRSMWLTLEDGSETLVGWLSKVRTNRKSGIAHIELDRDLAPYLFDLGQRFTQYQLYNVLAMKSAFSVRIYELMKSYAFQNSKVYDIDELKHLLMVDDVKSYERYPDFRRYVLEVAQREINELSDINISFEPITKGRKVVKVKFRIEQKDVMERWIARTTAEEMLEQDVDNS